jgi:uncharacterized membrane protein
MVNIRRWLIHAFMPPWRWRTAFPRAVLDAIEAAVRRSEATHRGEIRFAIENALAPWAALRGKTAHERAIEVFAQSRVWDTEENTGVLIYVLLADRRVEIVADRGIAKKVAQSEWDAVARVMQEAFRQGNFRAGALAGIEQVGAILARHFPAGQVNPDELPDRPLIVK